jgi:hypothetical protein
MFDDGGYAEVTMQALDVKRLLGAVQRYAVRSKKIPSAKVLHAIDAVYEFLESTSATDLTIKAEAVIGARGVTLSPVDMQFPGEP